MLEYFILIKDFDIETRIHDHVHFLEDKIKRGICVIRARVRNIDFSDL